MKNRLFDLLAMGPELRSEAERHGKSVNASYLLVHRIVARALREDLSAVPQDKLKAMLTKRLRETLDSAAA